MRRCTGKTNAGAPCRAPAGSGGLCFFHANPGKAHALGKIGGLKNRSHLTESAVVSPATGVDVCKILEEAIRDVRAKRISPRTGSALAQLCNSLSRVLPVAGLEARLAKLEQQLAEQASLTSAHTDPAGSDGGNQLVDRTDLQPGDENKLGLKEKTPGDSDPCAN